ncbi:MAG: isoleucine--tRNA ligase [Spirochaetes bacterium]|nr:isoleucine--tRNA ligase [Spirochaetota bacterium]
MDYSKTINLPATNFPMKANLSQREPEMLKEWHEQNIYEEILKNKQNADSFILHDGPPYANGNIHCGTALNKILKDIIVKHKTMSGFLSPYVPGWDCHGLPIELHVMKEIKENKDIKEDDTDILKIRKKCRKYAEKYIRIQMNEFKRLGVFADFEHPYLTMSFDYEAKILEILGETFKKGFIYRSKKPIYWCPNCETALAEAEVEYDDHTSPSIYVKFKVDPKSINVQGVDNDNLYVVIWTTTPWTLPANLALAFHPDFPYSVYKFGDESYILADGLANATAEATGKEKGESTLLSAEDIKSLKVYHPFINRESKVIFGNHVTLEQGTGIVHTAPGHGQEDYVIGLEYNLEAYSPVDDQGRYTEDFPEMKGINVFDANPKVIELLKEKNALIFTADIEHSYPHCWRCKKPLIFRATEQWFLKIDHDNMREKGLKAVDDTQWVPKWGETRFRSMVEGRPDWCISRQRSWGVPIPSFRCKGCGKNLMTGDTILYFSELSKKKSIDAWYTDDIKELIPPGTKCPCGSGEFEKEFDILDVWFDSGVSNFAVLDNWPSHRWPADIYLEGSDQHRGWFQSSLWPALALRGRAPYNTVITHGFVLDEKGAAMSKSAGNTISPIDLINKYGADILRLWVSSEDYRNDVKIGLDLMKQVADSYRRIRNTFKFLIGNLSDFAESDKVSYEDLSDTNKWLLHKLYNLSEQVKNAYENFEFHLVYRRIVNFCAVELSSIYFDISKDILYIEKKDSRKRRENQTVLKEVYETILRLIAPVLSFTSEEIWKFSENPGSIHMQEYYKLDKKYNNPEIENKMEALVDIKKDALKALELKRAEKVIGSSLEAKLKIFAKNETTKSWLKDMGEFIKIFFQVAGVELLNEKSNEMAEYDNSFISVAKSEGSKCARCWNITDTIGTDKQHPELCPRCTEIVKNL